MCAYSENPKEHQYVHLVKWIKKNSFIRNPNLIYRAEIDGLRALAVIPVILFHADIGLFSGGFTGVDVFFVISGYLITTILIEDIEKKRFNILNFYERRARRILPALYIVMLACIPFAWMWMLPSQMKDFSQSLVAVSLFASNFLFWGESGYFDDATEQKPLLHTWSLAVEEQYYALFPIFLILTWRLGKHRVFLLIVVMAAISLVLSEWSWRKLPAANFYLAPTRAWEIFAGSIASLIAHKQGLQKNNLLALLGLSAIIFAFVYYDQETPFPSAYALVPVLGTVLIILYGHKKTLVAKLLSTKGFVGIGLISYSAYLWHQPIFAFSKVVWVDEAQWLKIILILTVMPVAYLSWRYIEEPFRNRKSWGKNKFFALSILGFFIFILFGVTGHLSNGFVNRHIPTEHYKLIQTPEKYNSECIDKNPVLANFDTCRASSFDSPSIALIGDSHSHALYESLAAKLKGETIINVGAWACFPFTNNEHFVRANCKKKQQNLLDFLHANPQIHTIILSGYWGYLASGGYGKKVNGVRPHKKISKTDEEHFIKNAATFFSSLRNASRRIYLVEDVPNLDFNPQRCGDVGFFRFIKSDCTMNYADFISQKSKVDLVMNRITNLVPHIDYVKTQHLFCNEVNCFSLFKNKTLYRNNDHVSKIGADLIANRLIQKIQNE